VQHPELPTTSYTAIVSDVPGVVLTQNGTVIPAPGSAGQGLVAYTTAFLVDNPAGGTNPLTAVEVESRGRVVDECPELEPVPLP